MVKNLHNGISPEKLSNDFVLCGLSPAFFFGSHDYKFQDKIRCALGHRVNKDIAFHTNRWLQPESEHLGPTIGQRWREMFAHMIKEYRRLTYPIGVVHRRMQTVEYLFLAGSVLVNDPESPWHPDISFFISKRDISSESKANDPFYTENYRGV